MERNKSLWSVCIFMLIISFFSLTYGQTTNTHQTITTNRPKMFKLTVAKGDNVRVSIFNTNAQFEILFQMDEQQLAVVEENICFTTEQCRMDFTSEWDAEGVVIIQVMAYQYSYEVVHNGVQISRQENVLTNFIGGKFIYSKALKPAIYNLRVSYESDSVPHIILSFMDNNITITPNEVNEVQIHIDEEVQYYFFYFTFSADGFVDMTQHLFPVTIQLPNQMLKGCDGTNTYDPIIRACPIDNIKTQETLKINKLGSYPTFQLKQEEEVTIRITIVQYKRWRPFFEEQFLTVYIGESDDSQAFYGLNKFEISTRFKMKKQCSMQDISCNFVMKLSRGNYTVMPVFPRSSENSFIYLYERFKGDKGVERYYSILPTLSEIDKKFYQVGGMMEFTNSREKLTQITFSSDDPFLLVEYSIMKKSKFSQEGNMQLELVFFNPDVVFNQDLNKAEIYAQLQPNQTYLIYFEMMSQIKLQAAQKQEAQQGEDLIDYTLEDEVGASYKSAQKVKDTQKLFYLETQQIQITIRNGKFPHKKLFSQSSQTNENNKENQSQQTQDPSSNNSTDSEKQNLSKEVAGDKQSKNIYDKQQQTASIETKNENKFSTQMLLQVLGALLVILILLILVYIFFLASTPGDEKEGKPLETQQPSGSITLPDNSIEITQISQVIRTESSIEHGQSQRMEEQPNEIKDQKQ